jgi:hypothetical protein
MLMKFFIFNLLENNCQFFSVYILSSFFSKPEVKLIPVLRTENKDFLSKSKNSIKNFTIRV